MWVLIIVVFSGSLPGNTAKYDPNPKNTSGTGYAVAITTQEYISEKSCTSAGNKAVKNLSRMKNIVNFSCSEK